MRIVLWGDARQIFAVGWRRCVTAVLRIRADLDLPAEHRRVELRRSFGISSGKVRPYRLVGHLGFGFCPVSPPSIPVIARRQPLTPAEGAAPVMSWRSRNLLSRLPPSPSASPPRTGAP